MNTRILRVAALHAIAITAALAAHSRLTIALYDFAGLPEGVRSPALKLARRALADAGIDADWLICDPAGARIKSCSEPLPEGRYVVMNVMPAMIARPAGSLPEGDIAGYALTGSVRAYAFYDAVQAFAQKSHRRPSLILGCVLVHEIAHTLGLTHQIRGVMRPGLHPHDMEEAARGLAFTPAEGRQLRSAVVRLNAAN